MLIIQAMAMRSRLIPPILLMALAATLAGCGGGDAVTEGKPSSVNDSADPSPTSGTAVPPAYTAQPSRDGYACVSNWVNDFNSLNAGLKLSDAVIVGRVTDIRPGGDVDIHNRLRVSGVIAGNEPGTNEITLLQPTCGGGKFFKSYGPYEEGEKYLLFVRRRDAVRDGNYRLTHPAGRYRIKNERLTATASDHDTELDLAGKTVGDAISRIVKEDRYCSYNPVGIGSWGTASFAEFDDAELVAKVRITGHKNRSDEHQLPQGGPSMTEELLINEAEVLDVLKGNPESDTIAITGGSEICLPTDGDFYLYLTAPDGKYGTAPVDFEDDPSEYEPPDAYYIRHPWAQFPVRDGKIEVYEPFVRNDRFPAQFDGMTEAEFRQVLEAKVQQGTE